MSHCVITMARSLVAGANAQFRANESKHPEGVRILHDPFAHRFVERDPRIQAVRFGRFGWGHLRRELEELQVAHCVRHAAIDRLLCDAAADGFSQVVLIGAGYDMRHRRFPELAATRWFEVDHPATSARKWRILGDPGDVVRVPIDLATTSLAAALPACNRDEPTVFVLEGLIHYLSRARLSALFAEMADVARRRRVILSFIRTEMYEAADSLFIRLVQALREVPRLHFTAPGLADLMSQSGLQGFRAWTNAEQIDRFVPQAADRLVRLSQDVAVAGTT